MVAVYCASKAAVISITQSAGLALIKDKINVNGDSDYIVAQTLNVDGGQWMS